MLDLYFTYFAARNSCLISIILARAWTPALYLGMRPHKYGYPEDMPKEEQAALVKRMREKFVTDDLPEHLGYLTQVLCNYLLEHFEHDAHAHISFLTFSNRNLKKMDHTFAVTNQQLRIVTYFLN